MRRRSAPILALLLVISAGRAHADDVCPKVTAAEVEQLWQRYAPSSNSKLIQSGELECVSREGGSVETKIDGQTAADCAEFQHLLAVFKAGLQIQEKDVGIPYRP